MFLIYYLSISTLFFVKQIFTLPVDESNILDVDSFGCHAEALKVSTKVNSGCRHDRLFSVDFLILETFLKQFYEDFWGIRTFII